VEFTFRVPQHFLIVGVGSEHAAIEIGYGNSDSGILKDRSPPERLRSLSRYVELRGGIGVRGSASWTSASHIAVGIDS
jgi:hypothetical protein